ncbi:hypothetical protein RCH09_000449 [Actimicrobium sp. GrIS 1.19]|uniref:lytic transglycosylase domain-containing protein n=1 Tax=Actimicrobium sp. GrIS 1.19 TaxID=3071708 RepID=UPI002E099B8C|nr:hypothetical protein [Actimicrobium sp. GrIS 1.19]
MQLRHLLAILCCLATLWFPCARADDEIAASASAAEELVALAVQYEHGEGVPRDYLRAASLYCHAARDGSAEGLFGLGWMYLNGRGIAVDEGYGARLIQLAAAAGHRQAQRLTQLVSARADDGVPPCLLPQKEETAAAPQREEVAPGPDLRSMSGTRIRDLVSKLAPRYQIDPDFALAIIYIESGFNAKAVSPKRAQGLMQLMPDTALRFNVKNPFDPEDNIKGGLQYLRWLLAYFKGDVVKVAAAYNAGEGAVEAHGGVPPYPETRAYVTRLVAIYRHKAHPFDATLRFPAPSGTLKPRPLATLRTLR